MLGRLLQSHVDFFSNLKSWEKAEVAEELSHLANLKVRCQRDSQLVLRVLNALGEAMTDDMRETEPIAKALLHVLVCLDVTVFNGDPNTLLRLANTVTQTLQGCIVQSRQAFEHHRPALVALYQACTVIHRIAPGLHASLSLEEHQDRLLKGLKIFRDSPHYPYRFYAMLIEQSIHRFTERNEPSALFEAMRRFKTGTAGVLYLLHGFRSVINIDVDMASFDEGLQRLRVACSDDRLQRKPWFDWLQAFSFSAMICLTDPKKIQLFNSSLEQILEYQKSMLDQEERKAVRYGIVNELAAVATVAKAVEVRRKAMLELEYLATCRTLSEGWIADPEVYEGLLDAVSAVYQQGEFCRELTAVLAMLTQNKEDHLRGISHSWLGDITLERKLRKLRERKEDLLPIHHGLLLRRVWRNDFWLNGTTLDDRTVDAVSVVHQVCV